MTKKLCVRSAEVSALCTELARLKGKTSSKTEIVNAALTLYLEDQLAPLAELSELTQEELGALDTEGCPETLTIILDRSLYSRAYVKASQELKVSRPHATHIIKLLLRGMLVTVRQAKGSKRSSKPYETLAQLRLEAIDRLLRERDATKVISALAALGGGERPDREEISACGFCGSAECYVDDVALEDEVLARVSCLACGACGPVLSEEEAVAAWNETWR